MIVTSLKRFLSIPYPKPRYMYQVLGWSFFVGMTVYGFLTAFQPFGTYTYHHVNKYWLLLPYAVFSALCFAASDLIEFKKHCQSNWNIKKETIKGILTLLISSVFNYFYNAYFISGFKITWYGWLEMLVYTLLLGIPVFMLYFLGRYVSLNKTISGINITDRKSLDGDLQKEFKLKSDLVNESLCLKEDDFIMAQSEGNYCTVFFICEKEVKHKVLRVSLKRIEEQIVSDKIKRCHRSFIFNIAYAISMKGNAQGYKITLKGMDDIVPVSRKYIKVIKNCFTSEQYSG
ncbi:LytTR family DNA-binding domain-containing protein [Myroides indicus]|nr:LytTR family DNA-binding domain-containing protein [Myroides indicus]